MTKKYIITEEERIQIIITLDKITGTRALANWFELQLPKAELLQSEIITTKENEDTNKGD